LRVVRRNRRPVAYAFYQGVTDVVNEDGELTGEHGVTYSEPVKALMNVSGGRGQADINLFGIGGSTMRTIVTEDLETPFSEETVFWIETDPDTEPYDYRVVNVSRTVNQVVIAIDKVGVSE
jgi:hypothetical protein